MGVLDNFFVEPSKAAKSNFFVEPSKAAKKLFFVEQPKAAKKPPGPYEKIEGN